MEARGIPNASKNQPQKLNKGLRKGNPSQDSSKGGFGKGSGWIRGAFWEGFGGIWEPWASPNALANRYISKEIQVLPPGSPKGCFGEGSGRVWGDLGGFWKDLWKVGKVFLGDLRESSRGRLRESQGNLANPREP